MSTCRQGNQAILRQSAGSMHDDSKGSLKRRLQNAGQRRHIGPAKCCIVEFLANRTCGGCTCQK